MKMICLNDKILEPYQEGKLKIKQLERSFIDVSLFPFPSVSVPGTLTYITSSDNLRVLERFFPNEGDSFLLNFHLGVYNIEDQKDISLWKPVWEFYNARINFPHEVLGGRFWKVSYPDELMIPRIIDDPYIIKLPIKFEDFIDRSKKENNCR